MKPSEFLKIRQEYETCKNIVSEIDKREYEELQAAILKLKTEINNIRLSIYDKYEKSQEKRDALGALHLSKKKYIDSCDEFKCDHKLDDNTIALKAQRGLFGGLECSICGLVWRTEADGF